MNCRTSSRSVTGDPAACPGRGHRKRATSGPLRAAASLRSPRSARRCTARKSDERQQQRRDHRQASGRCHVDSRSRAADGPSVTRSAMLAERAEHREAVEPLEAGRGRRHGRSRHRAPSAVREVRGGSRGGDDRVRHRHESGRRRGRVGGGSARGHGWRLYGCRRGAGARTRDFARPPPEALPSTSLELPAVACALTAPSAPSVPATDVRIDVRAGAPRPRLRGGRGRAMPWSSEPLPVGPRSSSPGAAGKDGRPVPWPSSPPRPWPSVAVPCLAVAAAVERRGRAGRHAEHGEGQHCQGCEDAPGSQGCLLRGGSGSDRVVCFCGRPTPAEWVLTLRQVYGYLE